MKQSVHKPVSFCWEWGRNPNRKNYEATQGVTTVLEPGGEREQMLVEVLAASFLFFCPSVFRGPIII